MKELIIKLDFLSSIRRYLSALFHRLERYNRSTDKQVELNIMYNHVCGHCGKKIIEHNFSGLGTSDTLDTMREYYDIDSCVIPEGYNLVAHHNGWSNVSDYYLESIDGNKRMSKFEFVFRCNWKNVKPFNFTFSRNHTKEFNNDRLLRFN